MRRLRRLLTMLVFQIAVFLVVWWFMSNAQWVNPTTQHHTQQERAR